MNTTKKPIHVTITGERQTGKSSVLKNLFAALRSVGARVEVIYKHGPKDHLKWMTNGEVERLRNIAVTLEEVDLEDSASFGNGNCLICDGPFDGKLVDGRAMSAIQVVSERRLLAGAAHGLCADLLGNEMRVPLTVDLVKKARTLLEVKRAAALYRSDDPDAGPGLNVRDVWILDLVMAQVIRTNHGSTIARGELLETNKKLTALKKTLEAHFYALPPGPLASKLGRPIEFDHLIRFPADERIELDKIANLFIFRLDGVPPVFEFVEQELLAHLPDHFETGHVQPYITGEKHQGELYEHLKKLRDINVPSGRA